MIRHLPRIIIILLLLVTPAEAIDYRIEVLGSLGGGFTRARAINSSGQVVGESLIPTVGTVEHAFFYDNGLITDLGTLGGARSRAMDVNADGCVVGWSLAVDGTTKPVYWDDDGIIHELSTLGGYYGSAWGVNDGGCIVGNSSLANGSYHATLWSDSNDSDLGTLGGSYSIAYDINNSGDVVGGAYDSSGKQKACLWTDEATVNLGSLSGGSWNTARAVNDDGQIILWGTPVGSSSNHAAVWDGGIDDPVIDLGTFGGEESWAYGLNNRGQVVGWAEDYYGFYRAFVYDGTKMIDLGTLGGFFSSAYGINDDGVIVGYAQDCLGVWQAVKWTPVPEPSSLMVMAVAIIGYIVVLSRTQTARKTDQALA